MFVVKKVHWIKQLCSKGYTIFSRAMQIFSNSLTVNKELTRNQYHHAMLLNKIVAAFSAKRKKLLQTERSNPQVIATDHKV